jgi:hypothetical protein
VHVRGFLTFRVRPVPETEGADRALLIAAAMQFIDGVDELFVRRGYAGPEGRDVAEALRARNPSRRETGSRSRDPRPRTAPC